MTTNSKRPRIGARIVRGLRQAVDELDEWLLRGGGDDHTRSEQDVEAARDYLLHLIWWYEQKTQSPEDTP